MKMVSLILKTALLVFWIILDISSSLQLPKAARYLLRAAAACSGLSTLAGWILFFME
jgi:hypothetical protein